MKSTAREVLYSGAFGAGKTRCTCIKLVMRASRKGAREGLCRKHLVTLKATTLKTLLEADGELPPVLPVGSYTHNKSEKSIRIRGGGEIVYFGFDDPDKIGSYNLSGCAVDEFVELEEADLTQIRGRIRFKIGDMPNQIYGACNPGTPSHHLAIRFGLAPDSKIQPDCEVIETRSVDNWFLPKSYLADLATFTGLAKARFVEGKWVGSEGIIYDRWDRRTFVQHREGPWRRIIVGQDEGYTHPAVMVVVGEDNDGRLHVIREWYKAKQLESAVVAAAKELNAEFKPESFQVDPAAAKLRASMIDQGLPVEEAVNDVFGGIQTVQNRLIVAGDGRPRFTVEPTCKNVIREFETYEWKKKKARSEKLKDEPVKEFDDAMDALRYAIVKYDGVVGVPRIIFPLPNVTAHHYGEN